MSDEKKVFVNHPDGRICEVPVDVLDKYVVPPERVKDLTLRDAPESPDAAAGQPGGGRDGAAEKHSVFLPRSGQAVVFNFYLGPQARLSLHQTAPEASEGKPAGADVQGYHLDLDAFGAISAHSDWRVGPFIDRSGRPGFGPHSHDPASGNAQ